MSSKRQFLFKGNKLEHNPHNKFGWGGTCECPDGKRYDVGDNGDDCQTLACVNGRMISCKHTTGKWSGKKVTCAISKTGFNFKYIFNSVFFEY